MTEDRGKRAPGSEDQHLQQRIQELEAEVERLRGLTGEAAWRPDETARMVGGNLYKSIAAILDASPDAIITANVKGIVNRFNRGAEIIFGYRSSEMIGRPLDILMPERYRKAHRSHLAAFAQAPENGRLMNERGQILGQRKDGTEFPAEGSIIRIDSGIQPTFTVILRDITQRKQAEAALRESEALVTTLLDNLPASIHLKDIDGKYLRVNREYERQFGWTDSEMRGRTIREMQPEHVADEAEEHDREVLAGLRSVERVISFTGPLGERAHLSVKRPLLDSDGRPTAILCVETDITERANAETSLQEREAQLRQARRAARIGAFVWERESGRCVHCSDELAAIVGTTPEAVIEAARIPGALLDRVHPDDREKYRQTLKAARDDVKPYDVEYQFLRDDGSVICLREMGEPEPGPLASRTRMLGTIQDITEIRRVEETLRNNESQLRQAHQLTRTGVFIWDNQTDLCVYCSDDMAALFEVTPEQFIAERGTTKSFQSFVHEADISEVWGMIGTSEREAEPYEIEYRARTGTGEWRHYREVAEPILDPGGQILRFFGTVQDITGLRRTEEALRQSEEQYRSLIEGSIQGVLIHRNFMPVFANRALAEMFGYDSPEELLTLNSVLPLMAPEEIPRMEDIRQARESGGEAPAQYEFQGLRKDGSRIWLENRSNLVSWGGDSAIQSVLVDITERKTAEQALSKREGQLRAITDNTPAFITYVDSDRKFQFINRLAEEWYDRPAARAVGVTVEEILGPEGYAAVAPYIDIALSGEAAYFERTGTFPDGKTRSVEISYIPDRDEAGTVKGFYSLLQDITRRRRAEDALRRTMRSADLLRRIATAANEAASAEQAFNECLDAIGRYGGWHLADVFVLADDDNDLLAPAGLWWADDPKEFDAFRESTSKSRFEMGAGLPGRVADSRAPAWIEDIGADRNFPRRMMAGSHSIASGFAFPVLVGQNVVAVLEFFSREHRLRDEDLMDIAKQAGTILGRAVERQRAERALRDNEEQIRLMTDNVPVLITYIDRERKFRFVNRTTEEWYKRPAGDLVGQPVGEMIGKEGFARMALRIDEAMAGKTIHFEETLTYPDGRTRQIDGTYVPHFGPRGDVRGIFTMIIDATDRIRTEEKLRHAQRMEAIGKLTGGVAHDFNNLLAVIMGSSEIVRDELGVENQAVEAIARAARRGSELTQRLLAFSRQQPLRPRATDLAALAHEMGDMLSRTLGERVRIEVKGPDDIWFARVDTGELENAILNLAINARDAMPQGGTLTIETSNVHLSARQAERFDHAEPGRYVRLSLTDTGRGMPAEVLEHAFEPFFTTKDFGKGSGLGLSMVYGFATQSGGFAAIDSREGKGTTVSLYLPRTGAPQTANAEKRNPCRPLDQGGTIMVVEDDPDVRRLTVALLKSLGYTVLEASDGESALPILRNGQAIDLLLSDIVLTGDMSGPAIAEAALKSRPNLRILFMSGYAEDVIRRDREGVAMDVDADLLTKPFSRAELASKIKSTLQVEVD